MPKKIQGIALAIVQNDDGEVLIIKRKNPEKGKDTVELKWAFPGGKISDYESHEETAERETLEETGHYVKTLSLINKRKHPQYPVEIHYYECELATSATTQFIDDHEIVQISWVPKNDLLDYFETDLDKKVAKFLGL